MSIAGIAGAVGSAGAAIARQEQAAAQRNIAAQQASAERAMRFEREERRKQRAWQERMANTQYQRAIKDLQAAGLNPILAVQNGGNAVPSGSSAGGKTISGAQANTSSLAALMSAAPQLLGSIEMAITSAAKLGNDLEPQVKQAAGAALKDITGILQRGFDFLYKPKDYYDDKYKNGNNFRPGTISRNASGGGTFKG